MVEGFGMWAQKRFSDCRSLWANGEAVTARDLLPTPWLGPKPRRFRNYSQVSQDLQRPSSCWLVRFGGAEAETSPWRAAAHWPYSLLPLQHNSARIRVASRSSGAVHGASASRAVIATKTVAQTTAANVSTRRASFGRRSSREASSRRPRPLHDRRSHRTRSRSPRTRGHLTAKAVRLAAAAATSIPNSPVSATLIVLSMTVAATTSQSLVAQRELRAPTHDLAGPMAVGSFM